MGDETTFVKGMTYVAAVVVVLGSCKLLWGWLRDEALPWVDGHRWWAALGVAAAPVAVLAVGRVAGSLAGFVDVLRGSPAAFDDLDTASYELDELDVMDPYAFEAACAAFLVRDGFADVELVGGAGDLGADVLAWDAHGRKIVVQCKHYAKQVTSTDVQRFNGTARPVHGADVPLMVGLNGFTGPAQDFADDQDISLVGRKALAAWAEGAHLYDVIDVRFAA